MRGEWRFAMEDSGELCVMTSGIGLMLKWFVDSLDLEQMVNSMTCNGQLTIQIFCSMYIKLCSFIGI